MSDGIRSDLNRKALQLEYATIGWNVGEAFLTIGLGKTSRIDRLEITWPSGIRQVVQDPPLQRSLAIEESLPLTP